MKNDNYTVFGLAPGAPSWAEELIINTKDKSEYLQAVAAAKSNGYKITRIYKPDTVLTAPNFINSINI